MRTKQLWVLGLTMATLTTPTLALAQGEEEPPPVLSEGEGGGGGGGGGGLGGWDAKFGGIPSGALLTGELGYTNLPKVGYHMGMGSNFELGGAFALDLGYYQTAGINFGILLSVPMRIGLSRANKLSMAVGFEPGIGMHFRGEFQFSLLLNGSFNIGYQLNNQFTLGGGVDLPLAFRFTPSFLFAFPLLFGPVLEIHATPQLAITFDAKFGPWIGAGEGGSGVDFGLKMGFGVAYRL